MDYLDEYIIYRESKNTPNGTLKEFTTVRNRLEAYQKETGDIITLDKINLTFSDNLIKFLSNKKVSSDSEKTYHPNAIAKTFKILKTALNYFYRRREELNINLSDKFQLKEFGQIKSFNSDPIPLNDMEIKVIKTFNFNEGKKKELKEFEKQFKAGKIEVHKKDFYLKNIHAKYTTLEQTRKQMLLQIATGLRVSDLFRIKPANIKSNMIVMRPVKTLNTKEDNTIYIPLNSISKKILNEIKDSSKLKISSQKYNNNIKNLLQAVGIDDEVEQFEFELNKRTATIKCKCDIITSHNLRDTFISKAIRENVPIPVILKATGQSSYAIMARYIKLKNQDMIKHLGKLF